MRRIRVGVLRGGPSSEYDISLKTGGNVLKHLNEEKYEPVDVLISRDGAWHLRGFEVVPEKVLQYVDVVFNALHGEYGEDGQVQKILESFHMPYTGSRRLASAVSINKPHAKHIVSERGIRTPHHIIIERTPHIESKALEIFRTFPQPVVIKPVGKGSSLGVTFAGSYDDLVTALHTALEESPTAMVEEYVRGKEVTSGVVEQFRDEDRYTLLPIQIVLPKEKPCFDYDLKYSPQNSGVLQCPGNLSPEEKLLIRDATRRVHEALGLRHYSRSDFIVTPRGVYFLEANTLPGLTEYSLVPHALKEAGCAFDDFVDHLITLAVESK